MYVFLLNSLHIFFYFKRMYKRKRMYRLYNSLDVNSTFEYFSTLLFG